MALLNWRYQGNALIHPVCDSKSDGCGSVPKDPLLNNIVLRQLDSWKQLCALIL
jgi:hypothetical protein